MPISLFPNSTKPTVGVTVSYGSSTPDEFLNAYGRTFEGLLGSVTGDLVQLETLKANYERDSVYYKLEFQWGNSPIAALKEVELIANSFSSRLPSEMRDSVGVWTDQENNGFLAISFYSSKRSLDELYKLLEPQIAPQTSKVTDAADVDLWNPARKEIRVELMPERMATLQLFPKDIERAISAALNGYGGGSITIGTQQLGIQLLRPVKSLSELSTIVVPTRSGHAVHLSDIAKLEYGLKIANSRSFKTGGQPSLILFATPKAGGNVKRMSEDIIAIIKKLAPGFPADIEYRILVDPSEFIRSAISNVFHEVAIGVFLAVTILFLFIGSARNTITAAIEIPLSMVLAFILMKFSGMNLNLISLGGLALSAGMNVDASVVVLENIFRYFEEHHGKMAKMEKLSFHGKLDIIVEAVTEVRFAVIASTLASLVVFIPLAFTSDLSYAILGDLAKTVVFSHGFSAFVALILVPTVRLHLMKTSSEKAFVSPIEKPINALEEWYGRSLHRFIASSHFKKFAYFGLASLLAALVILILPRLPKEVLGKPDTD
ncbi:efflux RND transporter permease subunit [Bdellovibrionota bacterium FG-2]